MILRLAPSLLVAVALACGGGSGNNGRGTTPARIVVEAPAASLPQYVTEPSEHPVVGAGESTSDIEAAIAEVASQHRVQMRGDGRLGLLASWIAEHLESDGSPPPHEVVEFFARHLGLVEPTPHLVVQGQPSAAALVPSIKESVGEFLSRQPYNVYGVAIAPRDGLTMAVVALSARYVDLSPVARRVEPGSDIVVEGRLSGAFRNPTFAVAKPNGQVQRIPSGDGPEFNASIATPERGVYTVELIGQGEHGETVLANFPVYVGVDVPHSVSIATAAADGDARAVKNSLIDLINRTRRDNGLAPLTEGARLSEVALAHSRDMVENDFVGHNSGGQGPADRVRAAGFNSGLILENIGRGYSAAEIHRGLMQSPGHRANILNPHVSHLGIGVVGDPEGERTAFVATEVFIRMTEAIDADRARAQLLELLNRARRSRGARPLESHERLDFAAQNGAGRYFSSPQLSQQDVVDESSAQLREYGILFRRVGGLMTVVGRIEEASRLEPALDPEVQYIGIGVAQGNRDEHAANSIAVVILLGWPR